MGRMRVSGASLRGAGGALFVAISSLSVACGGRTIGDEHCPEGWVCTEVCAPGEACGGGGGGTPNQAGPAGPGSTGDTSSSVSTGTGGASTQVLDYDVIDAEFSQALSSIVMISGDPSNALHRYDVTTGEDHPVMLPFTPAAVAVEPSGTVAAVAADGHVAWVDLQASAIMGICPLSSNAYDVVADSGGVAHVMPRTDQWVSLHSVDRSTCAESLTQPSLWASSHLALHPSEAALFAADKGLSPDRVSRCDLTVEPAQCEDSQGQNDWGTYGYCGNAWVSADGSRLYTACGVVLSVPPNVDSGLCTYGGSLPDVVRIEHLSEAPAAGRVVFIPEADDSGVQGADPNADTVVRIHETPFLGFVAEHPLEPFPSTSSPAHGRFVFTTPAMDTVYVVVQAEGSPGVPGPFGITSFTP